MFAQKSEWFGNKLQVYEASFGIRCSTDTRHYQTMNKEQLKKLEADLWRAADSLRANSPFLIFYKLKNRGAETFNAGAGVPSLKRNHLNGNEGISVRLGNTTVR